MDVFHSNTLELTTVSSHRLRCIYCIIYQASGGGLELMYIIYFLD